MTVPLEVRILEAQAYRSRAPLRMPFRFGAATLEEMPVATLRLTLEGTAGTRVTGVSACGIAPLWFDKSTFRDFEGGVRTLLHSLGAAVKAYAASAPDTARGLHRSAGRAAHSRLAAAGLNDLVAGFGVALTDAAIVDGICRLAGAPFHEGLRRDLFGLGPEFARYLPPRPLSRMSVRHTVGLLDPLDLGDAEPLEDGLPQTLVEVLRTYAVRYFKVKIPGETETALERLRRIAAILDRNVPDYRVSLDGNEQFGTMVEFAPLAQAIARDPALSRFFERTLWVEQPVERKTALSPAVRDPLREVSRLKPVIIDESDGTDESFDSALDLGYGGVSAKNCKGIFRTLRNHRMACERGAILSSEDLTHVPVVGLHQDLAAAAALGIGHSERNGHHYVRGLSFLPEAEQGAALRDYPSLYRRRGDLVALEVRDGSLVLDEVNAYGFGVRSEPEWSRLDPVGL